MRRVFRLYESTIGKKIVMAVTGVLLVGFVVAHMAGNLKMYAGQEKMDHYGEFLREFAAPVLGHGGFLWVARAILLLAVAAHIRSAILLTRQSQAARDVGYKVTTRRESNYASLSMRWGGVFLAAFIVLHILHFTTGHIHPTFEHGAPYANVVAGFTVWWTAALYILAMIPLGLHLYHGTWSMLQTLGANHPRYNHLRRKIALAVALIVVVGNISFPVAVLTGLIK